MFIIAQIVSLHLFLILLLLTNPNRVLHFAAYSSIRTPTIVEAVVSPKILLFVSSRNKSFIKEKIRNHHLPAVFVPTTHSQSHSNCNTQHGKICWPRIALIRHTKMTTVATMTTKANENDQIVFSAKNLLAVNQISSILQNSVQNIECTNNEENDASKTIHQAIDLLHNMKYHASSFCRDESEHDVPAQNEVKGCGNNIAIDHLKTDERDNSLPQAPLQLLACAAISSVHSLDQLVQRVNQSRKSSRASSGHAWKALESAVSSTFEEDSSKCHENGAGSYKSREVSRALATLTVGLALSIYSTNASTTKMVASAVLPSEQVHAFSHGRKLQKEEGSKKMISGGNDSEESVKTQTIIYSMSRAVVLGLLRLAADKTSDQSAQGSVDLQIVAKIESGFSVGDLGRTLNIERENKELAKAVANVVDCVLGKSSTSDDDMDDYGNCNGGGELISKDALAPTFSLVANTRPWDYVKVEKLVRCAAELDLWCSAELLCDSAIASTTKVEKKGMMATSFPQGAATEALLTDSLNTSLPRDSIGHLAAGALIDITFDYRLYRRADVFASKYYSFGGPERFAEARFLHARDTITKVLKKRQAQIIETQIDRVDEMVAKVRKDLMFTSATTKNGVERQAFCGEGIAIETMSEQIREYSLRSLRASNMHAAAARLAKLWGMQYDQDPMQMLREQEERKLVYLQWNDEGCPGNSSDNGGEELRPLPGLISEPADLLKHFSVLENNPYVGFDCEWHCATHGVALLQLSTITVSLLIDIPALAETKEGCDALRATVEKLFTKPHVLGVQHVVGFACKDDIKRLRASPSATLRHWFPQNQNCNYEDLRLLIREVNPQLGGKGGLNFGLSRACEVFLGKQLDKAEQCSDWLARPLLPEQQEYAALDAWVCAAIAAKISKGREQVTAEEN